MSESPRVVIVTGGSRGIGRAIAERFASDGASLMLTGRDATALDDVADRLRGTGADVITSAGDVAAPGTAEHAVQQALERWGRVDVLVNNAGVLGEASFADTGAEEWNHVLTTNVVGPALFARAAVPAMAAERDGVIINIGSIYAHGADVGAPAYAASKAALAALTRQLAVEFGPTGVRCLTVTPGWVDAGMLEEDFGPDVAQRLRTDFERMPLRRLVTADEIAGVCLFVASSAASAMTGTEIVVDGGALAELHIVPTTKGY
ncbi:MAG TPA: SDR family oxidoreductase [Baekduia sp.]|nr:SDR family oxidoreductase [Baekduia sp.]